jgi:hypothetical protein
MVSIYNSGDWLENRIKNLLQSSVANDLEIWCVNANSPDPRDDEIPKDFPEVTYVKLDKKLTVYDTWNFIIRSSKSEFITNANTDDLIHPQGYQKLIKVLDDSDCGFAYPSWYCTATPNQTWPTLTDIDPGGKPGNFAGNIETAGVGHFPVWRRSLHADFGLFDPEFKALGDADWWSRCYLVGNVKFQWVNELLACYLWRNGDNLWHRELSDNETSRKEWALFSGRMAKYKLGKLE